MRLEIAGVRIARQEPEKLVNDRLHMQLLGRHKREALGEVKAHLMAEQAQRSGPGAVAAPDATVAHEAQKIEISLHGETLPQFLDDFCASAGYFHSSISR